MHDQLFVSSHLPLNEVLLLFTVAYILEKLHDCCFFDDEVQPSMFLLTLHDAMLHILEKHPESTQKKSHYDGVKA